MVQKRFDNPKRDKQYDEAIKAFMKVNRQESFTYGQVATRLGLTEKDDVLTVMFALQAMVLKDPDIIEFYPNKRLGKEAEKRDLRLFKFSPERKAIVDEPAKQDEVICSLILNALDEASELSGLAIYKAVKDRLGVVSRTVVMRCLDDLFTRGCVDARHTRIKNAVLYTLSN